MRTEDHPAVNGETSASDLARRFTAALAAASGTFVVEQQAFLDLAEGRISWLRVLCSGFVPVAGADAPAAARLEGTRS
jgi:hypothetical protein